MAKSGSGQSGAGSGNRGKKSGGGAGNRPGQAGNRKNSNSSAASAQRAIKGARQTSMMKGVVLPAAIVILVAAAVVVGIVVSRGGNSNSNANAAPTQQDTSSALLARSNPGLTGQDVDGVSANGNEQVAFHIHAHLAIYINGQQKLVPYGIGIVPPYELEAIPAGQPGGGSQFVEGGSQFYWLHTHDETGVIHIESPKQTTYTLGQFFDEWGQKLGPDQVGSNTGKLTAYVNGKVFTGDPRNIPLAAHNLIQLDLGQNVAPAPFTFPEGE